MRDSVTNDDLAIEAAKHKLAELAERDDYKAALVRVRTPERGPKVTVMSLFFLSGGSAAIVGFLAQGIGAWIAMIVLAIFALFMALAWLGFAQEKRGTPFGVAVVGKLREGTEVTELKLLRADGEQVTAIVPSTIFDLVKAGDVGVAWLHQDGSHHVVKDFERL